MAASFVEFSIENESLKNQLKLDCAWSVESTFFAISTFSKEVGGTIIILCENGALVEAENNHQLTLARKIGSKVSNFKWHPKLPILVCGWENKSLGCFSVNLNSTKWTYTELDSLEIFQQEGVKTVTNLRPKSSSNLINTFRIANFIWLRDGEELFLVTDSGTICLFEYKIQTNHLSLKYSDYLADPISDSILAENSKSSYVLIAYRNGIVCRLGGEKRKPMEIIQLEFPIRRILNYRHKSRLILITENFMLCQFSISNDVVAEISKIRLGSLGRALMSGGANKNQSQQSPLMRSGKEMAVFLINEENGYLAICIFGERVIRLFQVDSGQNLAVIVVESSDYHFAGISSIVFCEEQQMLIAGTSNHSVIIWQRDKITDTTLHEEQDSDQLNAQIEFSKVAHINAQGTVGSIAANVFGKIAFTINQNELNFVEKQIMKTAFNNDLAAIQITAKEMKLYWVSDEYETQKSVDCHIKGLLIGSEKLFLGILTNFPQNLRIFKIEESKEIQNHLSLNINANLCVIHKDCLWQLIITSLENNLFNASISCTRLGGNDISKEHFFHINLKEYAKKEHVITPISITLGGDHILLFFKTSNPTRYVYYIYLIQARQAQHLHGPIELDPNASVQQVLLNCNGSLISLSVYGLVYLVHVGENQLYPLPPLAGFNGELHMRWAENESRMLIIQMGKYIHVLLCWINLRLSSPVQCKVYEHRTLDAEDSSCKVIGIFLPKVYFIRSSNPDKMEQVTLDEFCGIHIDTVSVMLDFLTSQEADLNLMIQRISRTGQQDAHLWSNLARIAVKCGDLRMGIYCVGKLRWSHVIRDVQQELRSASAYWETDDLTATNTDSAITINSKNEARTSSASMTRHSCALATLATHLGLYEEAKQLLFASGDQAKLVQFHQHCNHWNEAVNASEKLNRKQVYFAYAKCLEEETNISQAMLMYEMSGTGAFEVPRMLFDLNEQEELRHYCFNRSELAREENSIIKIDKTNEIDWKNYDEQLMRWWAQYRESVGDLDEALIAYEKSADYFNWVRLLCHTGQVERARQVLASFSSNDSDNIDLDRFDSNEQSDEDSEKERQKRAKIKEQMRSKNAAMLYMGRHLENIEPVEAITLFLNCGAIAHAIRLCKANSMQEQLAKILINYGSRTEVIELISTTPETPENLELLMHLHFRAQNWDTGLRFGLRGRLWTQIRMLLQNEMEKIEQGKSEKQINSLNISNDTLEIAFKLLKENQQIIDILLDLLLLKGDHSKLIQQLILEYRVDINQAFLEKLNKIFNLQKHQSEGSSNAHYQMLISLAESSLQQGQYLIAAKLFSAVGDRLSAIKALILSGNTQKVINYANIARDKQVFRIAANYLQTLGGEENAKVIEKFYQKAGASMELNRFLKK